MTENDFCTKIPPDIILQILEKLPPKTLLRVRCVSKFFIPLISHPHFLKLHLLSSAAAADSAASHHLLYYESTDYTKVYFSFHDAQTFSLCKIFESPFKSVNGYLRLVGSCRGILCLFDTSFFNFVGTLILWNPFIGKFKILPSLRGLNCFRTSFSHMAVGFGFDHRSVDFKVVKILYHFEKEHDFRQDAYIYAVKFGSWRRIEQPVPCFMPQNWCSNVFVNGIVHWLAYKEPKFNDRPNCIMGLNVVDEVFDVMELPEDLDPNYKKMRLSPSVNERSLVLFICGREDTWEVWLMNDYSNVKSWTKTYALPLGQVYFPLKMLNSGEVLAAMGDDNLVVIDGERHQADFLAVCGLSYSFYAGSYLPSLALLDIGDQLVEYDYSYHSL